MTADWTRSDGAHFQGTDSLGGCSYESRAAFLTGDYFEDMKQSAYDNLIHNINTENWVDKE